MGKKFARIFRIFRTNSTTMSKNTNTDNTESIKSLIELIDKGSIVLPEFQRDFVWEVGKTYDLFDSLVRDIFIGSVIYGVPKFEITVREIDIRPRKGSGSRKKPALKSYSREEMETKAQTQNFRVLLDGQQRITSLYRACKGYDDVWFVAKRTDELPDNKEFTDLSIEEILYEFSGEQDRTRLCIKISDVVLIGQKNYMESEIKEQFFSPLQCLQGLSSSEQNVLFRQFWRVIGKIQDLLKAEKLLSYYMLDTTSEKFALFFERSNTLGLRLNFNKIWKPNKKRAITLNASNRIYVICV